MQDHIKDYEYREQVNELNQEIGDLNAKISEMVELKGIREY